MSKRKFIAEYPIKASKKIVYPYISTAAGLSQWFAEDVNIDEDKVYNFVWDDEDHHAKLAAHRPYHHVRFEFLPNGNPEDLEHPSFFELRLEVNELTEELYLKVIDYSEFDDEEELQDLWDGLVHSLKEIVGG